MASDPTEGQAARGLAEANAAGGPVIAMDLGSSREVVEDVFP